MPTKKITTKKPARRKSSPKQAAKRPVKASAKKRTVKRAVARAPRLSQVPVPPKPEPIQQLPTMDMMPEEGMAMPPEQPQAESKPQEPVDEVEPVISDTHMSAFRSKVSFYLGVVTGAAVLHVLVFALVAIVMS